jgi:hypothetical protein
MGVGLQVINRVDWLGEGLQQVGSEQKGEAYRYFMLLSL